MSLALLDYGAVLVHFGASPSMAKVPDRFQGNPGLTGTSRLIFGKSQFDFEQAEERLPRLGAQGVFRLWQVAAS